MAYHNILVALSVLLSVALAQNYNQQNQQYHDAGQQGYQAAPANAYAPTYENYGPDNAQYYYMVQNYDPYLYKNAQLNFNRYPGGAAFQLTEEGKGSHVNVNVETSRANGGYGGVNGGNGNRVY